MAACAECAEHICPASGPVGAPKPTGTSSPETTSRRPTRHRHDGLCTAPARLIHAARGGYRGGRVARAAPLTALYSSMPQLSRARPPQPSLGRLPCCLLRAIDTPSEPRRSERRTRPPRGLLTSALRARLVEPALPVARAGSVQSCDAHANATCPLSLHRESAAQHAAQGHERHEHGPRGAYRTAQTSSLTAAAADYVGLSSSPAPVASSSTRRSLLADVLLV